jgi:hypothetical protein
MREPIAQRLEILDRLALARDDRLPAMRDVALVEELLGQRPRTHARLGGDVHLPSQRRSETATRRSGWPRPPAPCASQRQREHQRLRRDALEPRASPIQSSNNRRGCASSRSGMRTL